MKPFLREVSNRRKRRQNSKNLREIVPATQEIIVRHVENGAREQVDISCNLIAPPVGLGGGKAGEFLLQVLHHFRNTWIRIQTPVIRGIKFLLGSHCEVQVFRWHNNVLGNFSRHRYPSPLDSVLLESGQEGESAENIVCGTSTMSEGQTRTGLHSDAYLFVQKEQLVNRSCQACWRVWRRVPAVTGRVLERTCVPRATARIRLAIVVVSPPGKLAHSAIQVNAHATGSAC